MASSDPSSRSGISRRHFIQSSVGMSAGLALYSTVIARHWIEITQHDIHLDGLQPAFDGFKIVQLSDIHLDEFTEPVFLRHVIGRINDLQADLVLLTGDFINYGLTSKKFAVGSAWQCANLLTELKCDQVYGVLGNHDYFVGPGLVNEALVANKIKMLNNACVAIERGGARFWIAGVEDPLMGNPDPELAVPAAIRNSPNEPVVLMCHAPDYVDDLLVHPAGSGVDLMLSGHTHGGQVRLPMLGALQLPIMGRKYVEGLFHLDRMQLYVNRGIGTTGVPFRLNCAPEISLFTLRA
jgi:predicted MPP superfamily phosphohydrolase